MRKMNPDNQNEILKTSQKGRRFGTNKRFNPAAIVCTCPKSGI